MRRLVRFFDHLHAHEEVASLRGPLLTSLTLSTLLVLLVAPASMIVVILMLFVGSLIVNWRKWALPVWLSYLIGFVFLFSLKAVLPGGAFTPEILAATFILLALSQSYHLKVYWNAELLTIWLLASNASVVLLDSSTTILMWSIFVMVFNFGQFLRLHIREFSFATLVGSIRSAARTALYTAPMLLFFIYTFQKSYDARVRVSQNNVSGISTQLEPGRVAKLSLRSGIAYRVTVDRPIPPLLELYWPAARLTKSQGLIWSRGALSMNKSVIPETQRLIGENDAFSSSCFVNQKVYAQETDTKSYTIGLDHVVGFSHSINGYVPVLSNICSTEAPFMSQAGDHLSRTDFENLTKVGFLPSQRIKNLVDRWKRGAPRPAVFIEKILKYYRDSNFKYSLVQHHYSGEVLFEDFMFTTREGYCEHYAAATATLLRMGGIPSRVVVGFQGGLFNELGGYWLVSYQDAHAWVEYWDGKTWARFDPTAEFAPQELRHKQQDQNIFMRIAKIPGFKAVWLGIDSFFFRMTKFFAGRDKILELGDLTMDPILALFSFFVLFTVFQIKKMRRTEEMVFQDQFGALLGRLAEYGLRRGRNEGFDAYRLRVMEWLERQERLNNSVIPMSDLIVAYEKFRFGSSRFEVRKMKPLIRQVKQVKRLIPPYIWYRISGLF